MPTEFSVGFFGGMNSNDQANTLVRRSHREVEGGFAQFAPMESPDIQDMDFSQGGITTRKGSFEDANLSSIMLPGDTLLKGIEWENPSDGTKIEVIVSKLTIYLYVSSWAQINDSTSSAYTHSANVTKCSFAATDGHLFIGLDGANEIQVYKNGADLDPALSNGNLYEEAFTATTHTITGTWTTGAYLIAIVHNRLVFSDGNTYLEYTPQAHTASQGIWDLTNGGFFQAVGSIKSMWNFVPQHTDSLTEYLYLGSTGGVEILTGFASTDRLIRIEGSKSPINHQAFAIIKNWIVYLTEDRNIYAINGSNIIDLGRRLKKPTQDGILDGMDISTSRANSFGFYNAKKEQAQIYISTLAGRLNDTCLVFDFKLGEPILGEQQTSFEQRVRAVIWTIFEPNDNDWFTHSYQRQENVIGVTSSGRIYKLEEKRSDLIAKQDVSGVTLTAGSVVSVTVTGHGLVTGAEVLFEDVGGTEELNLNTYVITSTGPDTFTLNGTDGADFTAFTTGGTAASGFVIQSHWFSPLFSGGSAETRVKQWIKTLMRTNDLGSWSADLDIYLDRSETSSKNSSYAQAKGAVFDEAVFDEDDFSGGGIVRHFDRTYRHSEAIQAKMSSTNANKPFDLFLLGFTYNVGAEVN